MEYSPKTGQEQVTYNPTGAAGSGPATDGSSDILEKIAQMVSDQRERDAKNREVIINLLPLFQYVFAKF